MKFIKSLILEIIKKYLNLNPSISEGRGIPFSLLIRRLYIFNIRYEISIQASLKRRSIILYSKK